MYYCKLFSNNLGVIYFVYECRVVVIVNGEKEEIWVEMIGLWDSDVNNFIDGIVFNECFIYVIDVEGDMFIVMILREGKFDVICFLNIGNSGYDEDD